MLETFTARTRAQFNALRTRSLKSTFPLWAQLSLLGVAILTVNFLLGTIFRPELFTFSRITWNSPWTYTWLLFGDAILMFDIIWTIVVAGITVIGMMLAFMLATCALGAIAIALGIERIWEFNTEEISVVYTRQDAPKPTVPPAMPEATVDPVRTAVTLDPSPAASFPSVAERIEMGDYPTTPAPHPGPTLTVVSNAPKVEPPPQAEAHVEGAVVVEQPEASTPAAAEHAAPVEGHAPPTAKLAS